MKEKIRILFYTLDGAGVSYFRSQSPAIQLERDHSDDFYVEFNQQIDFNDPNTLDYLKSFNIIHYHRQILQDTKQMVQLANELRKAGVVLIVDIDDYWLLHKNHPFYSLSVENKMHLNIIENLKIADYVTTTTDAFADEIRKVTGKDNVGVFFNAVDPTWMKQFQNNWKPDPDGKVRICYQGGSSHLGDLQQLEGVMNVLSNDPDIKDKFSLILGGWDCDGNTTEVTFNQEFGAELQKKGLWTPDLVKIINKTRGNVDMLPISMELKDKYRGKVFSTSQRDIRSEESVYFQYEKILTDNHRMIKNKDYLQWLMNFERGVKYENEGNYGRRWTQKANIYATILDECDIVIAPLDKNFFNSMKSNLKQAEVWTRKLPIVCTNMIPYSVHGRHMENCILIPAEKEKNPKKYWIKYLKKLILDADLRKKLGEQLYEDFKESHNLANVTQKRAEFYKNVVVNKLVEV